MAVAHKQRPVKKSSWLKRLLISGLCIAFLGWIVLMGWALIIWTNEGFESACRKVEALSQKQRLAIHEFDDSHFPQWLNQKLSPDFRKQSSLNLQKAQAIGGRLSQKATEKMGELISQEHTQMTEELSHSLSDLGLKAQQFWMLLNATGHLLLVKLGILVAAIPLFLLAIAAGLIDGLNQRAIRTASLGRESTYVFHKSIPIARRALFWVLGLWLALPHALAPAPVFVSLSAMLALLMSVTASRFKKYL